MALTCRRPLAPSLRPSPAARGKAPSPRTDSLRRLVNYSNLQIAVVELTSLERVKIFSLIEHLLPLIQSLFKGIFFSVVAVMCLDFVIAMCSLLAKAFSAAG